MSTFALRSQSAEILVLSIEFQPPRSLASDVFNTHIRFILGQDLCFIAPAEGCRKWRSADFVAEKFVVDLDTHL